MEDSDLDAVLKALADQTRRDLLERVREEDGCEVKVENGMKEAHMLHNHLPRLADHGFIEYTHTEDSVTVKQGENWDMVVSLLETASGVDLGQDQQ